ncbi:MAG: hypothetical protein Q9190_000928 [Brigantiaea leucoxantha]
MKRSHSPSPSQESRSVKKRRSEATLVAEVTQQTRASTTLAKSEVSPTKADSCFPLPSSDRSSNDHKRVDTLVNGKGSQSQQADLKRKAENSTIQPSSNTLKHRRSLSPPRQRKRPGGASRIDNAAKQAVLQRQKAREEEAKAAAATRGVQDVVREHYNAVPQRGREWRKTESRIKGLRSFNNWVKSVIIHKFSPSEDSSAGGNPLLVLDVGCGKGGDLAKWAQAPQEVELYVGIDPAEVSIEQARERYSQMKRGGRGGGRGGGFRGGRPQKTFHAEFIAQDAFGQSIGNIPIIQNVGFDAHGGSRWGGGGFDVVSMMFCMHYAFETEAKTQGMLQNIAGALKKGGRFIGTIPNSDVLRSRVEDFHKWRAQNHGKPQANGVTKAAAQAVAEAGGDSALPPQTSATEDEPTKPRLHTPDVRDTEGDDEAIASWGNSIYRVRFPGKTPQDGIFRPPFGWKYNYFLDEAVEVPEYVVPWEAFRG